MGIKSNDTSQPYYNFFGETGKGAAGPNVHPGMYATGGDIANRLQPGNGYIYHTFGADGIQLEYNGGNPRAHIGDGSSTGIKFDGTGYIIITGTHSDFNTGPGDWTIEFWAYKSATMTNHQIANTSDGSTEGHGWQIEYTSNILGLYIYDLANDWTHYAVEDDEASTGNWHHYAWVRDSNVHKLYRNGNLKKANCISEDIIDISTSG